MADAGVVGRDFADRLDVVGVVGELLAELFGGLRGEGGETILCTTLGFLEAAVHELVHGGLAWGGALDGDGLAGGKEEGGGEEDSAAHGRSVRIVAGRGCAIIACWTCLDATFDTNSRLQRTDSGGAEPVDGAGCAAAGEHGAGADYSG